MARTFQSALPFYRMDRLESLPHITGEPGLQLFRVENVRSIIPPEVGHEPFFCRIVSLPGIALTGNGDKLMRKL